MMSSNFDRGHSGNLSSPPQSIAEVLHFVQREWTSFHLEKSKWQEERASMQVTKAEENPLFSSLMILYKIVFCKEHYKLCFSICFDLTVDFE